MIKKNSTSDSEKSFNIKKLFAVHRLGESLSNDEIEALAMVLENAAEALCLLGEERYELTRIDIAYEARVLRNFLINREKENATL